MKKWRASDGGAGAVQLRRARLMTPPRILAAAAILLSLMFAAPDAWAAPGPVPPCAGDPIPAYPPLGTAPAIAVWRGEDLVGVRLPACARLALGHAAVLVAVAGRFSAPSLDAILSRLGAISAMAKVDYWSVSDRRYERLFANAAAVTGPDGKQRRPDFTSAEIRRSQALYFVETDNRTESQVVYRLRFQETVADNALITIDNVSSVTWLALPLLGPGDLRLVYDLRRGKTGWDFYGLSLVAPDFSLLSLFISSESYINRALALYRFFAEAK